MFTKQLSLCHVPACFDNSPLIEAKPKIKLHISLNNSICFVCDPVASFSKSMTHLTEVSVKKGHFSTSIFTSAGETEEAIVSII